MTSLNDFIKMEKRNALVFLDRGMSARNYSLWSSFLIPDGSDGDDIGTYTRMRITGGTDVRRLFALSVSECAVDRQRSIDGVARFDFVPLCRDPSEFVDALRELGGTGAGGMDIALFLGIDARDEPNTFLVDSLLESDVFSGAFVSAPSGDGWCVKKAVELLSVVRARGKLAKLSAPPGAFGSIVNGADCGGRSVCAIDPASGRQMEAVMRSLAIPAVFTDSAEPSCVRAFCDAGIPVSLSSGQFLLSAETLSGFAFRLFSSGLFSLGELEAILRGGTESSTARSVFR